MIRPEPECTVDVADALIAVEQQDQPCWRARKYLGSMLTLDFGGHASHTTSRGRLIDMGTSRVGIYDVFWSLNLADGEHVDSDDIGQEASLADSIDRALGGAVLIGRRRLEGDLLLPFSNGAELRIDLTGEYEVDDDELLASIALSGGVLLHLVRDGRLLIGASERTRDRVAA